MFGINGQTILEDVYKIPLWLLLWCEMKTHNVLWQCEFNSAMKSSKLKEICTSHTMFLWHQDEFFLYRNENLDPVKCLGCKCTGMTHSGTRFLLVSCKQIKSYKRETEWTCTGMKVALVSCKHPLSLLLFRKRDPGAWPVLSLTPVFFTLYNTSRKIIQHFFPPARYLIPIKQTVLYAILTCLVNSLTFLSTASHDVWFPKSFLFLSLFQTSGREDNHIRELPHAAILEKFSS